MRAQSSRSKLPGVYSVRGLLRKLQAFSIEGQSITLGHTLLTTSIDFFAELRRQEGEPAAHTLAATLATAIQQTTGADAIGAYVNDGTFHIVLPGKKLTAAREVADEIAQKFRAAQVDREPAARLPLTTAVVPWLVGVHPEELLHQGQETLAVARQSGGDCAVEQNAFAQELANWQNELTAGSPFGNVIAEDIMEPFPAVIDRDAPNEAMLAALRRSEAPVWPFVDHEGKLVGVASPKSGIADAFKAGADSVVRKSLTVPVTIDHNAAFPEIYEAFSSQGCLTMVVVADERPVGYLTCNGFLSLIEPINSATFAGDEPLADDSRGLLVGSLAGEAELGG
jgi:GGDEF domain-containing protein